MYIYIYLYIVCIMTSSFTETLLLIKINEIYVLCCCTESMKNWLNFVIYARMDCDLWCSSILFILSLHAYAKKRQPKLNLKWLFLTVCYHQHNAYLPRIETLGIGCLCVCMCVCACVCVRLWASHNANRAFPFRLSVAIGNI